MKNEIRNSINNPFQLEEMYRANEKGFTDAFNAVYPQLKSNYAASFWNARLNFKPQKTTFGNNKEILFVLVAALFSGVVAKLPELLSINEAFFYTRDIAFIVVPALTAYFAWKQRISATKSAIIAIFIVAAAIYINLLPAKNADLFQLSCIHLPLVLWAVLGYVFTGTEHNNAKLRLQYLSYNGNLAVMSGLMIIAGGLLSAATIGLFDLINLNINEFYFRYIVVLGLSATPMVATHLVQSHPEIVGKVSPVIARIFSPMVLVMLVVYLIAMAYTGKDPYNDRDFLLMFNMLLVGVMAIIFFSVAEHTRVAEKRIETWVLLLLAIATIIVNSIALSAILFRITSWGITPNRLAVLGSNLIIIINLLLVAVRLMKTVTGKGSIKEVEHAIAFYLPIYAAWAAIVTFIFPWIFAAG